MDNSESLCSLGFDIRFVVLCLLSLFGYLRARWRLPGHLRAVCSFLLQLGAGGAGAQLAVEQGAPGAFYLGGLLQTIHGLQGAQAKKPTVVVTLVMGQKLFKYLGRAVLCKTLIPEIR